MIEIPESLVLARQLNDTTSNKTIKKVTADQNPHKFAWYFKDPKDYNNRLKNKKIGEARAFGGKVEIAAGDMRIAFSEGINLLYIEKESRLPKKHQLLIEFADGTYLSASVQMYGGLWAFEDGEFDNEYYLKALAAVSPLSDEFNLDYFGSTVANEGMGKLSAKAFLATEQRFPGLGNGVLQDILYNARINPKRKVNTLSDNEIVGLFLSVKNTLKEMADMGGRNTETDLFGAKGGYKTKASKFTVGTPCPECGSDIVKAAYMGGSVYFCPGCQRV